MMRSLRRLLFGLFIACFASPVMAQGTLPIALQQSVNANGVPLAGAFLYTYVVGTVATPQTTYQDSGLTIANPWPLPADQTGRLGMFYMANGSTHVRLTDSTGVVIFDYPSMLVIGASGGSGGGGTVDPTTILSTGDEKIRYGTGTLTGFVRENGLTIGSAVSGATERANADTQNLFIYLYNADPNLVVSGGRTSNALNDFNSNKTIALPDMRGRINAFLDDMGNSAAGRLASPYFTSPTTLGAAGGLQDMPGLATTNLPPYTPSGSIAAALPSTSFLAFTAGGPNVGFGGASSGGQSQSLSGFPVTATFSGSAQGGASTPFSILPPIMLRTQYIKL